ncbi:MAG: hypothetical protein N5P05_002079 [Chroococcopsis gigantea SAG 12.99]|jgi:hypothetical protein|nr:hypothetical protein [Chroococcopsis gigantea SAG 12.99]
MADLFMDAPDVSGDDYCVFGLATCFLKEEGELQSVEIIEPIPSAAIEAIVKGIPTSYRLACAKSLGQLFIDGVPTIPAEFPPHSQFCDSFDERAIAATRTYKTHPDAQEFIPLGTSREDVNYSTDRKRVLNSVHIVGNDDNVKQHSHTHKVL